MSFEDLLADPHEQFDPRGELLASIQRHEAAEPATASSRPRRRLTAVAYTPGSACGCCCHARYVPIDESCEDREDDHADPEVTG